MRRSRSGGRCWSGLGCPHVRASLDSAERYRVPASRRRTGVLVGSSAALRDPFATLPVPGAETAVAAVADFAIGPIAIHCLHVPTRPTAGSRPHARGCSHRASARAEHGPCGVRRPQHPATQARERGGSLPRARLTRATAARARTQWDEAELGVVPGLRDLGYRDAYCSLHGYRSGEPSWTWQRISGHGGGWRLDQLFTSAELRPAACIYHHAWRDEGLSDHSALEADIVPGEWGSASAGQAVRHSPDSLGNALKRLDGLCDRLHRFLELLHAIEPLEQTGERSPKDPQ